MRHNNSIQRMGASRSAHRQFEALGRLAPTADAERWAAAGPREMIL